MESKWKKKDLRIELINYVRDQGTVSRIQLVEYMGISIHELNKILSELVDTSSLKMEPNAENSDYDIFTIPSDIERKSFSALFE